MNKQSMFSPNGSPLEAAAVIALYKVNHKLLFFITLFWIQIQTQIFRLYTGM